jgi:hypothetical protein
VWSLASPQGYLYHGEPYCGTSTNFCKSENGAAYDVVIGLVEKANVPQGTSLYFDNYFSTFSLFDELHKRGIGGTGTLRVNRLLDCPLKDELTRKSERGDMTFASSEKVLTCIWTDNKKVAVASNCNSVTPICEVVRWSRMEKKRIKVKMPKLIQLYNTNMGGVDLFDQMVSRYRINIRSKKWYWCIFSWFLNALLVNSWRFY